MRIWKYSRWDSLLLAFSLVQFVGTFWVAVEWASFPIAAKVGTFVVLAIMMTYNIIVVSHLFTHVSWFVSAKLNAVFSIINTIDIGQSVQAYHLTHVRNHHRFNNDAQDETGTTRDASSTYRDGKSGEHTPLLYYIFIGARDSLVARGRELCYVTRLWRVGPKETKLLALVSNREQRRVRELRQLQADRIANSLASPRSNTSRCSSHCSCSPSMTARMLAAAVAIVSGSVTPSWAHSSRKASVTSRRSVV